MTITAYIIRLQLLGLAVVDFELLRRNCGYTFNAAPTVIQPTTLMELNWNFLGNIWGGGSFN